jgi:hypothetical protein
MRILECRMAEATSMPLCGDERTVHWCTYALVLPLRTHQPHAVRLRYPVATARSACRPIRPVLESGMIVGEGPTDLSALRYKSVGILIAMRLRLDRIDVSELEER